MFSLACELQSAMNTRRLRNLEFDWLTSTVCGQFEFFQKGHFKLLDTVGRIGRKLNNSTTAYHSIFFL